MQQLPLQQLPNQSFSSVLDGNNWKFTIKTTSGQMSISLTLNDVVILENTRAVAGSFIIPYEYEEAGNFFFVTQNFQLPDYTLFNVSQALIYVTAAELAVFRANNLVILTAADFDPNGALPLRFKPVGY